MTVPHTVHIPNAVTVNNAAATALMLAGAGQMTMAGELLERWCPDTLDCMAAICAWAWTIKATGHTVDVADTPDGDDLDVARTAVAIVRALNHGGPDGDGDLAGALELFVGPAELGFRPSAEMGAVAMFILRMAADAALTDRGKHRG